MIPFLISRLVILICGTLYPAYASYKAVKTRDIKEYVKWMMYWIVFAFFTAGEIFLDVFLSFWFPFYYELKVLFVFWLLCPATEGSNFMYRKFVHPLLSKREKDIDEYIERCKEDGYSAVLKIGSKAVNMATTTFIETAVRQLPLAHQFGLLPLPPPAEVDSPSKRVRSSDMYIPSRAPIKRYASSTPLKDTDPTFLVSDDEIDAPRRARVDELETHVPKKQAAKRRPRSKSRGRKPRAVKTTS